MLHDKNESQEIRGCEASETDREGNEERLKTILYGTFAVEQSVMAELSL